jgi:hypothetical protein
VRTGFAGGVRIPLSTVFIILTAALLFGYRFATSQVAAVAMGMGGADYPAPLFWLTVLRSALVVLIFFSVTNLALTIITRGLVKSIFVALGFLPLLGVFANIPLSEILFTIVTLQAFLVLIIWQKQDYQAFFSRKLIDVIVLLMLFSVQYFMLFEHNSGMTELSPSLFRSFVLAKQFNFSALDFANSHSSLNSPLLQLITLIFDFPSVSVAAFQKVFYATYFILLLLGSYGVYAFLKYAARVNIVFAFFGGLLFSFSCMHYLQQADGGIALSPAIVLPYSMLALTLAFEKRSYALALASGIALAAQYFLLTPSVIVTLYSALLLAIFSLGLYSFHKSLPLRRSLVLSALGGFTVLSAYVLLPLSITGNVLSNLTPTEFADDFKLLYIFLPVSLILLHLQERFTPLYKSLLLLTVIIALWLKVSATSAIGIFFPLSVFLLVMITLDSMARSYVTLINHFMRRRLKGQETCSQT